MKTTMKKAMGIFLSLTVMAGTLTGCGGEDAAGGADASGVQAASELGYISVVSREDGSGTRGAFIELFGIEQKDASGEKIDRTTLDANITNSTSVMMTTVAGNMDAIGYISLGSMNDTVKAVKIDGAQATVDNIKNGSYKVARPFNIATKENISATAQDFIDYILSADGQQVVERAGYISQGNTGAYTASGAQGEITVAGSSSVTPVMEKLKEAYIALNPNVSIEVQQNDSTTGMTSTIEGICDIGMASRAVKDSELEQGLVPTTIAMDGIAVIVNNASPIDELTSQNVQDIFTGAVIHWSEISPAEK